MTICYVKRKYEFDADNSHIIITKLKALILTPFLCIVSDEKHTQAMRNLVMCVTYAA